MSNEFTSFSDFADEELNMSTQYVTRYADELDESYPNLAEDLRIKGDCGNYCDMKIHQDDVKVFVERVLTYKKSDSNSLSSFLKK